MKDFDSILKNVKRVAIAGHVRPDGDCVGSCLATYNFIEQYFSEIEVDVYLQPIPTIFHFLKNADKICHEYPDVEPYDVFIVQDCGALDRIGDAAKYFKTAKKTVCIDHHISNGSFADENYIFPNASSTSELVFDLMGKERITKEIAECIYVGMVHDTGVFQYSNTSAKTMNTAGFLMETGIDYSAIVDKTFYEKTYNQNRIMGLALIKSILFLEGKVIASTLTKQEMKQYEVLPKHLEGIVSQLRITKGVEVAIFLYQIEEEGFKVSMRSNGLVNVASIAQSFGGGGHVRAAGLTMEGSSSAIIEQLVEKINEQLKINEK